MTHIVYHKGVLYADRKCYERDGCATEVKKLEQKTCNGFLYTWAFCGAVSECVWGNKVVASNFNPEVIQESRRVLTESDSEAFNGILIVSPANSARIEAKGYLVNFFGDTFDLVLGDKPIVLGAYRQSIIAAYNVLDSIKYSRKRNIIEQAIRFGTMGTECDQTGWEIDSINIGV